MELGCYLLFGAIGVGMFIVGYQIGSHRPPGDDEERDM